MKVAIGDVAPPEAFTDATTWLGGVLGRELLGTLVRVWLFPPVAA